MYTDAQIISKLEAIPNRVVLDDDISQTLGEIEETLRARVQAATSEADVDSDKLFNLLLSDCMVNRGLEPLNEITAARYIRGGYANSLLPALQARETARLAKAMERIANVLEESRGFGSANARLSVNSFGMNEPD